eukprot:9404968-Pyramimonas_sp.AAC.1
MEDFELAVAETEPANRADVDLYADLVGGGLISYGEAFDALLDTVMRPVARMAGRVSPEALKP